MAFCRLSQTRKREITRSSVLWTNRAAARFFWLAGAAALVSSFYPRDGSPWKCELAVHPSGSALCCVWIYPLAWDVHEEIIQVLIRSRFVLGKTVYFGLLTSIRCWLWRISKKRSVRRPMLQSERRVKRRHRDRGYYTRPRSTQDLIPVDTVYEDVCSCPMEEFTPSAISYRHQLYHSGPESAGKLDS